MCISKEVIIEVTFSAELGVNSDDAVSGDVSSVGATVVPAVSVGTMVQNKLLSRHLIIHFPMRLRVSERANE